MLAGCGSSDTGTDTGQAEARATLERQALKRRALERRLATAKATEAKAERRAEKAERREEAASGGGPSSSKGGALFGAGAEGSFESLAASMPGPVGLAVAPLGSGPVETFGPLQSGHAWSTIKVPILVTLMRDRPEGINAEAQAWAGAALTASDNEAAAALFDQLGQIHGGLSGASAAVGETLAAAGSPTTVATAPPPAGAVSTYGQTEWSLEGSTAFYRSLANDCLLSPERSDYVLGLMGEVIPEQRWGLGEAGFEADLVAFKGGWGPESGGYLVRQAGLVRDGDSGVAVSMIARDGTYEGGAAGLTQVATWLRENLRGLGGPASSC